MTEFASSILEATEQGIKVKFTWYPRTDVKKQGRKEDKTSKSLLNLDFDFWPYYFVKYYYY